ncbi:MAG TPA: galactokinase family protein [Chloroflexia bacterium]|jgi:L-arabinokinase
MWQITEQRADLPGDVQRCLEAIEQNPGFFDPAQPITLARAPGRLDLMGGIADYSGSLVLQLPLEVATFAAVQRTDEPAVTVISHAATDLDSDNQVQVPLASLAPGGDPLDYAQARVMLSRHPRQQWAAYVIGVLVVLQREEGVLLQHGLRLMVYSEVLIGKGVSSSAALEVASMQAVCGALGLRLDGPRVALLCQKVENLVVGAPCGVMDQMTSACGEQGRLLVLLCQPAEIGPAVALPPGLAVWGIDSGVRHAVSGGDYESVRVGAFMGYRMVAELEGLQVEEIGPRRVRVTDPLWGGYLCNIGPSEWETRYRDHIPEAIRGDDFLGRYAGTTDAVTTIHPDRIYPVCQPTAHPIYEHRRVRLFKALLEQAQLDRERLQLLGELMYQSHTSYSACGLGSRETDRIVSLVREAGAAAGLYGAKITGGGSGGTVAVLGHRDAGDVVREITARYSAEAGRGGAVLSGSSPGAVQFGLLTVRQSTP